MPDTANKLRKIVADAKGSNDNVPRPKTDYAFVLLLLAAGFIFGVMYERGGYLQAVVGDQNIVGNSGNVNINQIANTPKLDWGDLTGKTRDIYRSEIFAHFPWALGPMKANEWTVIQEWLLEQRGIVNTNVRDIIRSRRNGDMPRQVATLLYSTEHALVYVGTAPAAHLTATWRQAAPSDYRIRQVVWKDIVIAAVSRAHGKEWADAVNDAFKAYE